MLVECETRKFIKKFSVDVVGMFGVNMRKGQREKIKVKVFVCFCYKM